MVKLRIHQCLQADLHHAWSFLVVVKDDAEQCEAVQVLDEKQYFSKITNLYLVVGQSEMSLHYQSQTVWCQCVTTGVDTLIV